MQDSEYLTQVPPTYLRELFFILTAFLRSLWRQARIGDEDFFALSVRLFSAFMGDGQEETGWPAVSGMTDEEQTRRSESRYFTEQAWLHLYVLADYAYIEDEKLLPSLACLLRLAIRELSPPAVLIDLPKATLETLWRSSFLRDQPTPAAQAVVRDLIEYSQSYGKKTVAPGAQTVFEDLDNDRTEGSLESPGCSNHAGRGRLER